MPDQFGKPCDGRTASVLALLFALTDAGGGFGLKTIPPAGVAESQLASTPRPDRLTPGLQRLAILIDPGSCSSASPGIHLEGAHCPPLPALAAAEPAYSPGAML
jgi:hypothetical protein